MNKVLGRRAYFSPIGAIATPSGGGRGQAFLPHPVLHDFFGYKDWLPSQGRPYPAITKATVMGFEKVGDDTTDARVFVRDKSSCAVVKGGAPGKTPYGEPFSQRIGLSQGIHPPRFLPVVHSLRVDAQAFFNSSLVFLRMSCSRCHYRMVPRRDATCRARSAGSAAGSGFLSCFMDGRTS